MSGATLAVRDRPVPTAEVGILRHVFFFFLAMSLHRVLSSGPPDNPLPSDPGSRSVPRVGCKGRHCQAGRRRPWLGNVVAR